MVQATIDRWGTLDAMICNAGIASSRLLLRLHPDEWTTVLETNLTGTFHCLKAVGRHMLTRQEGTVIIIGSFAAVQGRSGQAAYAASKAGLLGLVKTAAREWGGNNIRVNAIFPGRHRTDLSMPSWDADDRLDDHLLGRAPDLQAVARSIYHLALQQDISGQAWNLDSRLL
jgi:3-oxoacyl-[acyl-carrier protein] reductase